MSKIAALALARQGRSVAIFERWQERYSLPRAVCIDHEIYRVLCTLGLRDRLPAVSHAGPDDRWINADWKELLAIDWASESISGGPEVNFVHQPTMEALFDEAVLACPNVQINLGWEAIDVCETVDAACLRVRRLDDGSERQVRCRFLIGADGGNSLVREAIGGGQHDKGFEADRLVIDVLPNEGQKLDIPDAAQYCNPARPTTIVPAGVREGRYFRRWEFMRLLDSYQIERHPHVSDVIDLSMYLGRIICVPDPVKARERDEAFFSGKAPPPPAFPQLTEGLLQRRDGERVGSAGRLSPHGHVRRAGTTGRFDDVVGTGFVLIGRHAASLEARDATTLARLDGLKATVALVTPVDAADARGWADLDNKHLPFMDRPGIETMLVRRDFYLYGAVGPGESPPALVSDCLADLQEAG